MGGYEDILNCPPYGAERKEKTRLLTKRLWELTRLHRNNCSAYRGIIDKVWDISSKKPESYYDLPFLPVQLFKEIELRSVEKEAIFKTMTSSGTTGQMVSKIYLDRDTASNQQKTLVKIVSDFTGASRMPMIILDCPSVVRNRAMFSARGAGILGFSIFGSKKIYAFDDEMNLDLEGIQSFLTMHEGKKILLFGFTYMIWQFFYKELKRRKEQGKEGIDLSRGILIHGGGWKKLQKEAVTKAEFKEALHEVCRIEQVCDYYGMVEQTGCIYMECECGNLHTSTYSDVIMRRMKDFSICGYGEKGVIQVVSAIPQSYPGHSILTEDEGILLGEDDCPCGRKGKYFEVTGRIKQAEVRGCSDTYE